MIRDFDRWIDQKWLDRHIRAMYRLERKQNSVAWCQSAEYVHQLMLREGFASELISIPSDGVTDFQDKRTPIGWDCSHMTLSLLTPVAGIEDPLIADYEREPLHAVKHSVATPPEGIDARIVTEERMRIGEDVRGAFVLLEPSTRPRQASMRMLLDLGAIGWISDYCESPMNAPDGVSWINAGCEYNNWHVHADDREYISYQITPRTGYYLRAACNKGTVKVHAESDGRRFETVLPVVTAVLPGESKREVWLNAHLYEPLIDDNSAGVIGSVAILKALREMAKCGKIRLKYSVRVVFASEMYGFAAFADHYGDTRDVLGAIVMDGIMASTDKSYIPSYKSWEAIDYHGESRADGFAGNILLADTAEAIRREFPEVLLEQNAHKQHDDMFLSDSTNGIRTVWIIHGSQGIHHNSVQIEDTLDTAACARHLSFCGEWVRKMAALDECELRELLPAAVSRARMLLYKAVRTPVRPGTDNKARLQFLYERECKRLEALRVYGDLPELDEAIRSLKIPEAIPALEAAPAPERPSYAQGTRRSWYDYADDFIFTRVTRGYPHDLVRLPREKRVPMPGTILYNDIADILSRMTPGVTMQQLIREVEWDLGIVFSEQTIRSYLFTCTMLAEAGYLAMTQKHPETAASLAAALRELGVQEGDTLLVHSSLSGLGYLPGGAETAIEALRQAVGKTGTFLTPAFTRPYIMFEGTTNKSYTFRPYDTRPDGALRDATVNTGSIPKAMLKMPDAARSGHSTHEWTAIGAEAEACVAGHGFLDPPTGATSPLAKALQRRGSVVFLGCTISSNTFLHFVEDQADAPFLQPAVIQYIDKAGETHTALIPKHLPGDRDFYHDPAGSDFYAEATARGLHIQAVPFGMGTLYRMDLQELYDIGMAMFREDPCATLCRNPKCDYCRSFRSKTENP